MQNVNELDAVSGEYALTDEWALTLPEPFESRMEDGDLVLWRPGMTIWCFIWGIDAIESREDALEWVREDQASEAFDTFESDENGVLRYRYRLFEETNDFKVASMYGFAFSHTSYIQLGIYLDDEADYAEAVALFDSLAYTNRATFH
ncbi:hypothetical protein [Enterovibrio paralichthyis]|uniref:hypothetical protein n=1 Tax=Enterovibrio paralichthyis TaxID=2853805 RepID=UPI0006D15B0E|nr:hypothetical protein [Enterovibrio paralichthyis]MBV7298406.1 hypothetical protein [Enterovibrio paralichthyis]